MSGTLLFNYHFINCMINRLKLEGHKVFIKRNDFTYGVSKNRQALVDDVLKTGEYEFMARYDDDVILEPDYQERLMKVIEKGYDLASGVTVPMMQPVLKRDPKHVGKIINRVILDDKGNFVMNRDDCGFEYTESKILPAHHFRSCALYKSEIHDKVNYLPTPLSMHGFREEEIISFKMLMAGFKIGVDTKAVNYHQLTPSGGERPTTNMTGFNEQQLKEFTKNHKDELNKIFTREDYPSQLQLKKENNLIL